MIHRLPGYIAFILILVFCISFRHRVEAQPCILFKGEKNIPVAFAHIKVKELEKNETHYFVTDQNGKVCADLKAPLEVEFSHIGYFPFKDTIHSITPEMELIPTVSSFKLDDVVVTAQHSPTTSVDAMQKINVISLEQIEDKGSQNLYDLLNNQLNIRLSTDNVLGSNIEMMGMGGDKVKILINGIPVIGRLDGNIDLSQINLNNVERVEIVEGPLSVVYGNDALAGTINLITKKKSDKKVELFSESYYESVGQYNFEGGAGLNGEKSFVRLTGGRYYFDGHQGLETGREKQWDPKEQLFGKVLFGTNVKHWDLSLSSDIYDEVITDRGAVLLFPAEDDPNRNIQMGSDDYFKTFRWSNTLNAEKKITDKYNLKAQFAYNYFQRKKNTYIKNLETLSEQKADDPTAHDTTKFHLYTTRSTLQSTLFDNKVSWELGYDLKYEVGSGPRIEGEEKSIGDYAGFMTVQWNLAPKFSIRTGVRGTHNTEYDAPFVPSIDVKYKLAKNWQWRASYGRGFRAPNLKDLYYDFVDINHNIQGNPDLRAETSHAYSTSLSYQKPLKSAVLNGDVKFYYNDVEDLIDLAQTNAATGLFQNVNVSEHRTLGTQVSFNYRSKFWNVGVGTGYMGIYNIEYKENKALDEYFYSPEAQLTASHLIDKLKLRIAVFYKFYGERKNYAVNADNEVLQLESESYSMSDISLSRSFYKNHIHITTGVKNLFDVDNIQSSTSGGAHSSNSVASIAWGRTYFVKLKLTL